MIVFQLLDVFKTIRLGKIDKGMSIYREEKLYSNSDLEHSDLKKVREQRKK